MAKLTGLRGSVLTGRIEADLALGEGASLVGELRALLSADPLAERPCALLMRALYAAAALAGPVLALPVPPRSGAERPESCASVRLLRDRAVAVRPDFELDRTTRPR